MDLIVGLNGVGFICYVYLFLNCTVHFGPKIAEDPNSMNIGYYFVSEKINKRKLDGDNKCCNKIELSS